jgi:ribosomal protein S10
MEKQNIRIKLRAYDNKILDASTEEIVNTVKRTGATIKGPYSSTYKNRKIYSFKISAHR